MAKNDLQKFLLRQHLGHSGSVFDEGRNAFWEHGNSGKCPYTDQTRRTAWIKGFNEAKQQNEAS